MNLRKQSSTDYPYYFELVLSIDHLTPATGKTPTLALTFNDGSTAAASGAVTEIGSGVYSWVGNSTDRAQLGELIAVVTATGCDPKKIKLEIVDYDPFVLSDSPGIGTLLNRLTALRAAALDLLDAAISSRLEAADYIAPDNVLLASVAGYVDTEVAAIKTVTDKLNTAVELDGPVYRFTTNALELAAGGATADQIWDELLSGHTIDGSTADALSDILSKTSLITQGTVVTGNYIDPETLTLTIVRGDSYTEAVGRTLPPWTGDWWPDLTGKVVNFHARKDYDDVFTKAMEVTEPQEVFMELTSAETAEFSSGGSSYRYDIEVTIGTEKVTLARGAMVVQPDVS